MTESQKFYGSKSIFSATALCKLGALLWVCLTITLNTKAASEKVLFDFQTTPYSTKWQVVNDDVMGGASTSQFKLLTNGGAIFSGVLSLDNNGGFASVRSGPVRENLGGGDAILLRFRGDGRRYKFTVRTGSSFDAPKYQAEFTTKRGECEEHRLAFKDFVPMFRGRVMANVPPLNPADIASVGVLIADKQAGPFHLELIWIRASIQ